MKYNILALVILALNYSCSSNETSVKNPPETSAISDNSIQFLTLFPEIKGDTIHIWFCDSENSSSEKFHGKQIDIAFYHYFLEFDSLYKNVFAEGYHLFSCNKLNLLHHKTGLIIRGPSQYSESAVDLYIWDNIAKKIVACQPLSDGFGDEGWYFIRDAWIIDANKDKSSYIIIRQKDSDTDLDDSTQQTEYKDSLKVLIWKGNSFEPTKIPVDTCKFQLQCWEK